MSAPLEVRHSRRYAAGQAPSLAGTWIETAAQALLILKAAHTGFIPGATTAARYAPLLLCPTRRLLAGRFPSARSR